MVERVGAMLTGGRRASKMPTVLLLLLTGCSAGTPGEAAGSSSGSSRFSGQVPSQRARGLRLPLFTEGPSQSRSSPRPCPRSGCRFARDLSAAASHTVLVAASGALGETVFTVPDRGYPEKWFEIISPADPPVRIESGSGRVLLTRKLPGGQSEVLVKVRSLGEDGDWYLCHLKLVEAREESLEWMMYPFPYLGCVDPGAQKGTAVYQLVARHSNEKSSSGGVEYVLIEGGDKHFEVDKDSGIIHTTGSALTWNKEYVLSVEATSKHGHKSSCASVSILAGSRPPQFTNTSYSLLIPESTLQGERVAVVEAVSFQNKALVYSLLMNPSNLFSIHQESGELSLTQAVDYESLHHLHHLIAEVVEAESGLSSITEIMVRITDDNDCAPEFLHTVYSRIRIREDIPIGTSLLQVLARDCDSGSNAEISYFIQSTEFSITPQGAISSSQQLDYERANHMYEFVVVAKDKGYPPQTGTALVRIQMENINDEAPMFTQAVYKTFLSEDAGPNTLVTAVHAEDPDGDGVSYMIVEGNEEGAFELDSQKGFIKLHRSLLSKLKGPQYILNITAVDDNSSGGPGPLCSFAQVIVGINDVNNNKPVFREMETALAMHVSQVECVSANCSHCAGCISNTSYKHDPTVVTTGNVTLASDTVRNHALCSCLARENHYLLCSSYTANPCLNGGTCVDTEVGYRCQCPISFHGPECQQTKRTFLGGGYAWFPPSKFCFEGHISLEFITEVADGLLLYDGPMAPVLAEEAEDFIALELKNGTPSLTINHGSGSLLLLLSPDIDVADQRWHSIQILSSAKKVRLILDNCANALTEQGGDDDEEMARLDHSACDISGETPGGERFLDVSQPLQLGGVKDSLPYHKSQTLLKGFIGCIRNLIVDSKLYDMEQAAEALNTVPGCAITDGQCQSAGVPSCGHHGYCLSDWDTFSCKCPPGLTGPRCEKELPEASFEGRSWIHYQLKDLLSSQGMHIQLMARTRASSGTLLRLLSSNERAHLSLQVTDGRFGVHVNAEENLCSLVLRTIRVDDGQWILLSMERHENEYTLRVNHGKGEHEVTRVMGLCGRFVAEAWNVVLGNNLPEYSKNGFQGCMRDVRLDGWPLHLDGTSTEFSVLLSQQDVIAGCSSDACHDQPCHSPLHCVDIWRKYECRCPVGKVEMTDNSTGLKLCGPAPCVQWSCKNGGTCLIQAPNRYVCQCAEGYKGRTCETRLARAGRMLELSSGSILVISMCFLVFLALLVSYTVWSQWGRAKFRKNGDYQISAKHVSWEHIQETVLNYSEEDGREHEQNVYNKYELKMPLRTNMSRSSSKTKDQFQKTEPQPKTREHFAIPQKGGSSTGAAPAPNFRKYVSQIVWEADNDPQSLLTDILHIYSSEGQESLAGSLNSWDSSNVGEDLNYNNLKEHSLKFEKKNFKKLYKPAHGQA